MTDLIRSARRILDEVSEAKGVPMLLGVRVPGTVEACARVGIDIETWLREDLVDRLLTGGGYSPYTSPAEELVRLGHDHDVPVYPCINCGAPELGADSAFRGAASNIYWAGADGIYLWNYQYRNAPRIGYGRPQPAVYELLRELASPQAVARGDKLFGVENVERVGPYAIASHPTQLPLDLGSRALKSAKSVRLRVGDDLGAAQRSGRLDHAVLALVMDGVQPGDSIAAQMNGAPLSRSDRPAMTWDGGEASERLHWNVAADAVKPGDNRLTVWIDERSPQARDAVTLNEAWLQVTYR